MFLLRRPILALAGANSVRDALTRAPVTSAVVRRFVPGPGIADALDAVRELRSEGLQVSLDHLGEHVTDQDGADGTVRAYVDLLHALDRMGLVNDAEISLKPSALGSELPDGGSRAIDRARSVVREAYRLGGRVTLDMEGAATVGTTLQAHRALRAEEPDVGVAIQAMLHRTAVDLDGLPRAGCRVRLVKGAYDEPPEAAHQDPAQIDLAYARALRQLMTGDWYPMVATHDPRLIAVTEHLAAQNGRGAADFEFQMLYGVRPDEQRRLVARGFRVRVYVPYGTDWYGYLTRRLAERPANLTFFLRSLVSRS